MRHPESGSASWGGLWFAKFCLYFVVPLVFLVIAFHDREAWFVGLSVYWIAAIVFFARRASGPNVSLLWRLGLGAVMLASWGYAMLAVYAPTDGTRICYDRIITPHRWAMAVNLGPDPLCDGIPLDQVVVD